MLAIRVIGRRQPDPGRLVEAISDDGLRGIVWWGQTDTRTVGSVSRFGGFYYLLHSGWLSESQVILVPQSVGPVVGRMQRAALRWLLTHARTIMLRERESQAFLQDLLPVTESIVLPDLAFGLPPVEASESHPKEVWLGLTLTDRGAQLRFPGPAGL